MAGAAEAVDEQCLPSAQLVQHSFEAEEGCNARIAEDNAVTSDEQMLSTAQLAAGSLLANGITSNAEV